MTPVMMYAWVAWCLCSQATAENALGTPVTTVVIALPSYLDGAQREVRSCNKKLQETIGIIII